MANALSPHFLSCHRSGHIPVVSSIGETSSSQLVSIDASHATTEIAKAVQPIKVLLLNRKGGLLDGKGEVRTWSTYDVEVVLLGQLQLVSVDGMTEIAIYQGDTPEQERWSSRLERRGKDLYSAMLLENYWVKMLDWGIGMEVIKRQLMICQYCQPGYFVLGKSSRYM